MVRYADDTFLGFEHREEAEAFSWNFVSESHSLDYHFT